MDIVLVLDRSGSMAGDPLTNMKAGAKKFIDIIDESTDSSQDGQLGGRTRIGIVSFSDTAVKNTQLITSVDALKAAVDSLTAGGSTNHADAFTKATELFSPPSGNQKVIVMFTDGKTTTGPAPSPIAAAARASGVIIYSIGLIGSDGIDVNVLNDWSTDPDASHVAVAPDDDDLEQLFEDLAANISQLGVTGNEGASLEFYIRHTAQTGGIKKINQSITYTDTEGNVVTFPDPTVTINCDIVVYPEDCPVPIDLVVDSCRDSLIVDLGDTYLQSPGRIVQLDVTVKNVCPGKRVALAVILTEVDEQGMEYQRGMKTVTLPAHNESSCGDILVKCVKFVLPEDLDVSGRDPTALCPVRNLRARFIAHYIDTDYRCCESVLTL